LIQTGINKMTGFMVNFEIDEKHVAEANRLNRLEYERIRDFIILHYKLNGRSNPFWQHVRAMPIPASLEGKMSLFRASGDIKMLEQESFKEDSWVSMYYGFGVQPHAPASLTDPERIQMIMNKMKIAVAKGVQLAPSHAEFIQTIGTP
jgi:tryptophan halogenase